jgi:magnesium-transporting ATPase (P-type)
MSVANASRSTESQPAPDKAEAEGLDRYILWMGVIFIVFIFLHIVTLIYVAWEYGPLGSDLDKTLEGRYFNTIRISGEAMDIRYIKTLVVHLAQIGVGMAFGFLCIFMGSVLCWKQIQGEFKITGDFKFGSFTFSGGLVGIALLIGGMLIVALSIHKDLSIPPQPSSIVDPELIKMIRPNDHKKET